MKSVLFPTDFSDASKSAKDFAVQIARTTNAKLNLLHVYEVPYTSLSKEHGEKPAKADGFTDDRENARTILKYIIDSSKMSKHPHRTYIRESNLIKAIEDISKKEDVDLLVMGIDGDHRSKDLPESNTFKIIRNIPRPILLVPSSIDYKPFLEITYLIDPGNGEQDHLEKLQQFSDIFQAHITLLHIASKDAPVNGIRKKLRRLSDTSRKKLNYQLVVHDDLFKGVEIYLRKNKVDLLAMTTHSTSLFNRLFHASSTRQMIGRTKLPLLIFS